MKSLVYGLALIAIATATVANAEVVYTDDFEGGANPSGWHFRSWDTMETTGGNPGYWVHNDFVLALAPDAATEAAADTPFHGNYAAEEILSIGVDARTDAGPGSTPFFDFGIVLKDTKGTPELEDDDWAYYNALTPVPQIGEGWTHYDFAIPSQSMEATPAGWRGGYIGDGENWRPGYDWTDLMNNVDEVSFWWLDPAYFGIDNQWDVGIDNASISRVPEPASLVMIALGGLALIRRR